MTGSIIHTNSPSRTIGAKRIRVPDAFYKAVYAEANPPGMVGFILPHEGTDAVLCAFVTNVDAIEEMTGLDFFSALPLNVQSNTESTISRSLLPNGH